MTFTLSLRDPVPGAPPPLVLTERDVVIGRAADADWTIPDPQVSSRHLLIGYRDGAYLVRDTSSNGTTLNGRPLASIHRLVPGDVLTVGGSSILFGEAATRAAGAGEDALPLALAEAVATLLATRQRQRGELGVSAPDALAGHPLANGGGGFARLRALSPGEAAAEVARATAALERHHAATVAAMQAALRATLAEIAPAAIAGSADPQAGDEARQAGWWRTFVARYGGEGIGNASFVDRFAAAFREQHERLASGPSSAPRPPS